MRKFVLFCAILMSGAAEAGVSKVSCFQVQTPVLVGYQQNEILGIEMVVDKKGFIGAMEFGVDTKGTTHQKDIKYVEMYYMGTKNRLSGNHRFGGRFELGGILEFKDKMTLKEGKYYFFVSYAMRDDAAIDGRIDGGVKWVSLNGKKVRTENGYPKTVKRMGVKIRAKGDGGSMGYRIPGLARTKAGSLVAVYDIRYHDMGDLPGDIDVGVSRSTDGGRTWEKMRVGIDMGDDKKFNYDGVGDPAVLVDEKTGRIWVAALWSHGNRAWHGSGPGITPTETGQLVLVYSDDDGKTWSKSRNITKDVKNPTWRLLLNGPGKGITMRDGTLVFTAQYRRGKNGNAYPWSTILYSKDQGKTWVVPNGGAERTTEAQVVELEDGVLMLNCRNDKSNKRVVLISEDMGKNWIEHKTSRKALLEPGSCMASLIRPSDEVGYQNKNVLLFSNPFYAKSRSRMTIRQSEDLGETWQKTGVLLDEYRSAGYSCMAMVNKDTVGILYEGSGAYLVYQVVGMDEIRAAK